MTVRSGYYVGAPGTFYVSGLVRPGDYLGSPPAMNSYPKSKAGSWLFQIQAGFQPRTRHPMQVIDVVQSTAVTVPIFMRNANTDLGMPGLAAELVVTSKPPGSAFGTISPTVTDRSNGWYDLAITGSMVATLGLTPLRITAPGTPVGQPTAQENDEITLNVVAVNLYVTPQPVNVTEIAGDSTAPGNVANMYNGTGYFAPTGPAQQEQVYNIAVTGAALNQTAASSVITTGTDAGGVGNTTATDLAYDAMSSVGGALDFYYQFTIAAYANGVAVGVQWVGYLTGLTNAVKVFAFNWGNSAWDELGTIVGSASTQNGTEEFSLTSAHTGTGGNAGLVRVRFQNTGLTTATLNTDRILLGFTTVAPTVSQIQSGLALTTDVTSAEATIVADIASSQAAIIAAIPSDASIASAVLDAARSGHITLGSVGEGIALACSLLQGNFFIDNVTPSANGPTAQRLRCWLSASAMSGVTPGGSGEGEFATFLVTTTYSGPGAVSTHKVVQQ